MRFPVLLCLALLLPAVAIANPTLELNIRDHRIDMSARNVDVKTILLRLRNEANIAVRCPAAITKKVTLDLSNVRLEKGLKRILKGLNHAALYARPAGGGPARVVEIQVFAPYSGSPRNARSARRQRRLDGRIRNYQKRVQQAQQRLARVDAQSPTGKRYRQQIRRYRSIIERLQRQTR